MADPKDDVTLLMSYVRLFDPYQEYNTCSYTEKNETMR